MAILIVLILLLEAVRNNYIMRREPRHEGALTFRKIKAHSAIAFGVVYPVVPDFDK